MPVPRGARPAAKWAAVVAAAAALLLPVAAAAPPPETLATCNACHGAGGNSQLPRMPSLAGQPKLFIENQLVLIREGLREIPEMKGVLAGMADETIVALAAHYAASPPAPKTVAPDADKARRGAETARRLLCGTCHLPDFSGQKQVPRLAGQNEAYLLHSMQQFRDNPGPGRDTIMAATLRGLGDTELVDLAHYFASFRP